MNGATPRRRRPTRWLLVAAVAGVSLLLAGTEALVRLAPLEDRTELRVEGVPPLGHDEEVRMCVRRDDDQTAAQLREEFVPGGRISSAQVYACPAAYDRLEATFVGEAVGEILPRDSGGWLQVNDDDYALETGPVSFHRDLRGFNTGLSVWLPDHLHGRVDGLGRSGQRGTVLLLTGTLVRADVLDGGGITFRADDAEVLAPSVPVPQPLHVPQAVAAAVLAVLAAGALLWARHVRRL